MPGTKKKRRTSGEQGEAESTPQQGRSSGRPGERTAPPERGAGPTGLRGLTHTKPSKEVCLANDPRLRETPQSLRDSSPFRRSSTFIITGQRACHRRSLCKAGRPRPVLTRLLARHAPVFVRKNGKSGRFTGISTEMRRPLPFFP